MTLTAQIDSLIDKLDGFEILEAQIAAILAVEVANQQTLATGAGKDPKRWKLRVFQGRANPWEEFMELDQADANKRKDASPIVNVNFDRCEFPEGKGNTVERQQAEGYFNVDSYAYGVARSDGGSGHIPGDQDANDETQRATRLVRNILMSSFYTYLGLQGNVGQRWPDSIQMFQPGADGMPIDRVQASRLVLRVRYNEFSPQYTPQLLDEINATVKRAETGEVFLVADYKFT